MQPPLYVAESTYVLKVLELFKSSGTHFAIVLDEYGGTEGLVTMEDVLEELVGEIHDEFRRDRETVFTQRADGSWLVDGGASIEELSQRFDVRMEGVPRDYSTVSGLVLGQLERIPTVGDTTQWRGLTIEVVDMDGRRIDKLLVHRVPPSLPSPQSPA